MGALNAILTGGKLPMGYAISDLPTFGEGAQKGAQKGAQHPGGFKDEDKSRAIKELQRESIWIDINKGAQLLGVPKRTVQYRCKAGHYTTKQMLENGGLQYRILLSSLPVDAQMKYWSEHLQQAPAQVVPTQESPNKEKSNLTPKQERIALAWVDFLTLYLDCTAGAKHGQTVRAKRRFIDRYNGGEYPHIQSILGELTYKTVERQKKAWLDACKDYTVLAPGYKTERSRTITRDQAETLLSLALAPNKLRINEVVRLGKREMERRGIPHQQSDSTFRRWLSDWRRKNYAIWLQCRDGEKAVNDQALPYIQRDYSAINVGDIVVADGHDLNFEIINPITGKPKRMTLIVLYDMASNLPLGWEIMPTENTRAIASAFRRGILTLGFKPRVFYLDNGRAFRSKFFTQVADFRQAGLCGLFERLGCEVINAWPYHAQSKTVERFFGTFGELERRMPTYTGTSIDRKPARLKRGEKWHIRMHEMLSDSTVPTLIDAHYTIAEWLGDYAQRPQSGHLAGRTPLEVFQEGVEKVRLASGYSERQINAGELHYLMMDTEIKTLYRNGIKFMGTYYFHEALYPYEKGFGNCQFVIRYDIEDLDSILVYLPNGKFLCQAARAEKIHPAAAYLGNEQDELKLQGAIQQKRELQKQTRGVAQALWSHFSQQELSATLPVQGQPEIPLPAEEERTEISSLKMIPDPPSKKKAEQEDPGLDVLSLLARSAERRRSIPSDDLRYHRPVAPPARKQKIYLFETDRDQDELAARRKAE